MGILACWDVDPAERLYDPELAAKLKKGDSEPISMDVLRQTDFQQLILWFAFAFRPAKETFSEKKKCLTAMLKDAESVEDACGAVDRFLHGLKPVSVRPEQDERCRQPAALRRLCEMLIIALDPASSEKVAVEFSYALFLTSTVFDPAQELLLPDEGIAMMVKFNPFDDPAFERKALEKLRSQLGGARGGRGARGAAQAAAPPPSRQVLLRNEEGLGVGVFAPGEWTKGEFFCWYLGLAVAIPHGRHVLTSIGSDAKYNDGSNSHRLPLSEYMELGAPGASVNSSRNRDVQPNLRIDRNVQIQHEFRGKLMVASPLFVAVDFANAPTCWDYDPDAAHGGTN